MFFGILTRTLVLYWTLGLVSFLKGGMGLSFWVQTKCSKREANERVTRDWDSVYLLWKFKPLKTRKLLMKKFLTLSQYFHILFRSFYCKLCFFCSCSFCIRDDFCLWVFRLAVLVPRMAFYPLTASWGCKKHLSLAIKIWGNG